MKLRWRLFNRYIIVFYNSKCRLYVYKSLTLLYYPIHKLMKLLFFFSFTIIFWLSSCATMFNSKYCKTDFRSKVPMTAIIDSTTIELIPHQANVVTLARDTVLKEIVLIKDTARDTIGMYPHLSSVYYLNILSYGVGFLFDKNKLNKWKYPSKIDLANEEIKIYGEKPNFRVEKKPKELGKLNLHVSLPYVNLFYSAYGNENKWDLGFGGVSLGFILLSYKR